MVNLGKEVQLITETWIPTKAFVVVVLVKTYNSFVLDYPSITNSKYNTFNCAHLNLPAYYNNSKYIYLNTSNHHKALEGSL